MPPTYAPLVDPARPSRALWRLILGAPFAIGVYVIWMLGMGAVVAGVAGLAGLENHLRRLEAGSDPWAVILLLATFVGGWLGTWAAVRVLHRRSLGSLLGRAPRVLRDFVLGTGFMLGVGLAGAALAWPFLPALEIATDPRIWLTFLPLALLGVLIQTGAEELFFRGYLQSQLAARFASPLVWLLLPSVFFGFAHYAPDQTGDAVFLVVAATGLFGLIAADLTARSGSLGLAWGLHFANNVLAILVISIMGTLDGLALLRPAQGSDLDLIPLLLADMVLMVLVWALCRAHLRRR